MENDEPNRSQKRPFWWSERGQTLVEYSLILALFSIAVVVSLGFFQGGLSGKYGDIVTALEAIF